MPVFFCFSACPMMKAEWLFCSHAVSEYSSSVQTKRLNKLTRLHSLYCGCCNTVRWRVTRKADRENNYGARTDGSRAFENSRRRAPLPQKSARCARERKQITSAAPKFAQILLTFARRLEKRRVVSFGNIKNRSHRVSTVVSRSTIFFHCDRISPE